MRYALFANILLLAVGLTQAQRVRRLRNHRDLLLEVVDDEPSDPHAENKGIFSRILEPKNSNMRSKDEQELLSRLLQGGSMSM